MSFLLSIDPGIRGVGAALFDDGVLLVAEYVKNPEKKGGGPREALALARVVDEWCTAITSSRVHHLVLEWPQTYGGRSAKGDTNDLFALAAVDGAIAGRVGAQTIDHLVPHDWKGSIGKPKPGSVYVIESRVRAQLSSLELPRVRWPNAVKLTFDVTDAIGIGLHALGRFAPRRVFARE